MLKKHIQQAFYNYMKREMKRVEQTENKNVQKEKR